MPEGSELCEVWECRPADTYFTLHNVILIEDPGGGDPLILDPELPGADRPAWEAGSAVAALLAVAGFEGRHYGMMRVVERAPNELTLCRVRGFRAARADKGKIEAAVRRAMTSELGGWWPLVLDTTGFNACPVAFEAAWEAAGKPPVLICQPRVDPPEGKGASIDQATARIDGVRLEYKRHALELPAAQAPGAAAKRA
jgi:hypothetical protein